MLKNKHIFVCIKQEIIPNGPLEYVITNFCGMVVTNPEILETYPSDVIIYLCGDVTQIYSYIQNPHCNTINVVKELSSNFDNTSDYYKLISIGEVPININNVGVYFREFFDADTNYFTSLSEEHQFQSLTESNKETNAFRKGIYLSKIEENNEGLKFNLLRCSTNFEGPTDNFRKTDNDIIDRINNTSKYFFNDSIDVNHVLAQIYENKINEFSKEKKAKIKSIRIKQRIFLEMG